MTRTEYVVQAASRSTGSTGRWVPCSPITPSLGHAKRIAADRRRANGQRVIYRIVSREVTPWTEVGS